MVSSQCVKLKAVKNGEKEKGMKVNTNRGSGSRDGNQGPTSSQAYANTGT